MEWWIWLAAWVVAQPALGGLWYLLKGRDRAYDARRGEFMEQLLSRRDDSAGRSPGQDAA